MRRHQEKRHQRYLKEKKGEAPKVEEAMKLPVVSGEALRDELKAGDVLFTAPNRRALTYRYRYGFKPISELVQGTDFGHAMLYIGGGRVMESTLGMGVRNRPLKRIVAKNNVIALRPDVPAEEKKQAVEYALSQGGLKYNIPAMLRAMIPLRGRREGSRKPEESNSVICSALVANAYPNRKFSDASRLVTRPDELMAHEVMKPVAALVRFNKPKT